MKPYEQSFSVSFDYPVVYTRNVFKKTNKDLLNTLNRLDENRHHRALVFIDSEVALSQPKLVAEIQSYFEIHGDHLELAMIPKVVPGGEEIKNNYRLVMEIVDIILEHQLCRQSFVLAIGGGAVLDAVGFATSIVHRGLRMVRLPSTTLAQNDAGIGVKNGMNLHGGKNTIGTFHPPFAVINDFAFLDTLSDEGWAGGISEAFKVAIIKDKHFFEFLCKNAPRFKAREEEAMQNLIIRCAELHLEHIRLNGDAFEQGTARPLDFGHWAAHKLETMSNYEIAHGQAVAVGIMLDSLYAGKKGWITPGDVEAIYQGLIQSGLPLWYPVLESRLGDGTYKILRGLSEFQEHLGGDLCITFPEGIGQKFEVHKLDESIIEDCLAELKTRAKKQNAVSDS